MKGEKVKYVKPSKTWTNRTFLEKIQYETNLVVNASHMYNCFVWNKHSNI